EQGNLIGQLDLRKFPDEAPNVTILQTYVNPGFICPTDPKAQEPVLKNRRQGAGSHNPPTCQGLWYTGSMGPTIPDRCDFVLDQLRSREVCMGANFGTRTDVNQAPCFLGTRGLYCPDRSGCVGVFCRNPKGFTFREISD